MQRLRNRKTQWKQKREKTRNKALICLPDGRESVRKTDKPLIEKSNRDGVFRQRAAGGGIAAEDVPMNGLMRVERKAEAQ